MVEITVCDCEDRHGHIYKNGENISPRIDKKSEIPSILNDLYSKGAITLKEKNNASAAIHSVDLPD